jgi:hypothetical protein
VSWTWAWAVGVLTLFDEWEVIVRDAEQGSIVGGSKSEPLVHREDGTVLHGTS